jgi:glycosyltransferase involved in cell wall biosynthesis
MRFCVDAHAIGQHLTGNEVYVRNLLSEFARLDTESDFSACIAADPLDPAVMSLPAGIRTEAISRNPIVRLGWELTGRIAASRPDLVHVQYTAPLVCAAPIVVTVHDVSFFDHPEFFPWPRTQQLRFTVKNTAGRAARVITPSEFSRREIMRVYGLRPEKVVAIPNGVSSAFRPISHEAALARLVRRYALPAPFILTVGDLQLRKNQTGLILAFEALLRENPSLPHHLVLVGKDSWFSRGVRRAARASAVSSRIHFTGWVGDEDLVDFYNAAEAFVFPSLYEGFGLPVLEAMASGCPVACSNRTATYEVADSCAITFNPDSTADIVRAMRDLLLDAELRGRMGRLGQQRAAKFTWETAARRTLNVYYEVAERARVRKPQPAGTAKAAH